MSVKDKVARGQLSSQFLLLQDIHIKAFKTRLSQGLEPACLAIEGDSTGNDDTDWFYLFVKELIKPFPAYTVYQRSYETISSYSNECYGKRHVPLQVGTNGLGYATFDGTTNSYLSTPDSDALAIPGRGAGLLTLQGLIAPDTWAPASAGYAIVTKNATSQRSYGMRIASDGTLTFGWSPDGTTYVATSSTVATNFVANSAHWVRATFNPDNGSSKYEVKFYTSENGITWTQLGNTVTGGAISSLFDSTAALSIARDGVGTFGKFVGKIYSVSVRYGIDNGVADATVNPIVACVDFDAGGAFTVDATSFNDLYGNPWTVANAVVLGGGSPALLLLNASCSGKGIQYSSDAANSNARFNIQAAFEPQIVIINYSHNDSPLTATYRTEYELLCSLLVAKWPNAGIICSTQNPEKPPRDAVYINGHAKRNVAIMEIAGRHNYPLIDAYGAFMRMGNTADLNADEVGVHPLQPGYNLWRDVALDLFRPTVL